MEYKVQFTKRRYGRDPEYDYQLFDSYEEAKEFYDYIKNKKNILHSSISPVEDPLTDLFTQLMEAVK